MEEEKKGDKKKNVLEILLSGERVTETIETKRGTFTIVLPLPKDIRRTEVIIANRLGGQPASSFTSVTLANIRAYATLDVVVVEAPEWWQKLESAEDCPDDDLILNLYRRYLLFYNKTQRGISKSRFRDGSGVGKARAKVESVDNGTFSDIAN